MHDKGRDFENDDSCLVPTTRAGLKGVTGINLDHHDPFLLGFVDEKRVKLGKAPRMEAVLCFRVLLHRGTRTNMRQVLNHNCRTDRRVLNNALPENMVVIFALPKQFPAQFLEMAFCTLCAFGLQFPLETEDPTFLLFPATFTPRNCLVEVTVGRFKPKSTPTTSPDGATAGSGIRTTTCSV